MDLELFISNYETDSYIKRANAISIEIESYFSFKTGDVMDFGCKTGVIALNLKNKVKSLSLVDSSKEMVQAVDYKLASPCDSNINTFHGDIYDLNFGKKFDIIYISLTLHHFIDVQRIVDKLCTHLKKNGKLIVVDFLPNISASQFNDSNFERHRGFKIDKMVEILNNAGLNEVMGRKFYSSYHRNNESSQPYSLFSIIGKKV